MADRRQHGGSVKGSKSISPHFPRIPPHCWIIWSQEISCHQRKRPAWTQYWSKSSTIFATSRVTWRRHCCCGRYLQQAVLSSRQQVISERVTSAQPESHTLLSVLPVSFAQIVILLFRAFYLHLLTPWLIYFSLLCNFISNCTNMYGYILSFDRSRFLI